MDAIHNRCVACLSSCIPVIEAGVYVVAGDAPALAAPFVVSGVAVVLHPRNSSTKGVDTPASYV